MTTRQADYIRSHHETYTVSRMSGSLHIPVRKIREYMNRHELTELKGKEVKKEDSERLFNVDKQENWIV